MDEQHPDRLVVARNGSPLILGVGDHEMFIASDLSALVRHTTSVVHLDDGELATVTASGFRTFSREQENTDKAPTTVDLDCQDVELGRLPALHAQGDPRAAVHRSSGCCAAAWTSGSAPRGWTG